MAPVVTAFFTTSVTGCSAYLKVWPSVGVDGAGAVSDTPDSASVTTLPAVASSLDGRCDAADAAADDDPVLAADGLAGVLHATLAAMSTAVLMTMAICFMCSYRRKRLTRHRVLEVRADAELDAIGVHAAVREGDVAVPVRHVREQLARSGQSGRRRRA